MFMIFEACRQHPFTTGENNKWVIQNVSFYGSQKKENHGCLKLEGFEKMFKI